VVDRPGNWEPIFRRIYADVQAHGDLHTLRPRGALQDALLLTNQEVLADAERMAEEVRQGRRRSAVGVAAVVVWEGELRGPDDLTAAFAAEAHRRGIPVTEVPTL
jgi:hypothetical protein